MSMSAVAAEVGGSKSTLWRHFPSKSSLFAAAIERATSEFHRESLGKFRSRSGRGETIATFARNFIAEVSSPEAIRLQRLMAAESERFPTVAQEFLSRLIDVFRFALAEFLAKNVTCSHLRPGEADDAASMLMTLCLGIDHFRLIWGIDGATDRRLDARATRAVSIFERLYSAPTTQDERWAGADK